MTDRAASGRKSLRIRKMPPMWTNPRGIFDDNQCTDLRHINELRDRSDDKSSQLAFYAAPTSAGKNISVKPTNSRRGCVSLCQSKKIKYGNQGRPNQLNSGVYSASISAAVPRPITTGIRDNQTSAMPRPMRGISSPRVGALPALARASCTAALQSD